MKSNGSDLRGHERLFVPAHEVIDLAESAESAKSAKSAKTLTIASLKTAKTRKIFSYTGAKDRLLGQLKQLSSYAAKAYGLTYYQELFGGSGALLLNQDFSFSKYWYNETKVDVYSLMAALGDVRYAHALIDKLKLLGVGRSVFDQAKNALKSDPNLTLVERAAYTYISIMQSHKGLRELFDSKLTRGSKPTTAYHGHVQGLRSLHPFLSRVRITNEDAFVLLAERRYDRSSLLYLDPPYHPESGMTGNKHYDEHSLSAEDHRELVQLLLGSSAKIILSGYDNADYERLVRNGWKKLFLGDLRVSPSKNGKIGHEYVWLNFEPPPLTAKGVNPG